MISYNEVTIIVWALRIIQIEMRVTTISELAIERERTKEGTTNYEGRSSRNK